MNIIYEMGMMNLSNNIFTQSIIDKKNRIDGILKTNEEINEKVLGLFEKHEILTARSVAQILGVSREHAQRQYFKPLLDSQKIKKISNTKGQYQLIKNTITKSDQKAQLFSESEIIQTQLVQNWINRNSSKKRDEKIKRFARLCLGEVDPSFYIHPDGITADNWKEVIIQMKNLQLKKSNLKKLNYGNRQVLRHIVIYGLGITLSKTEAELLGIGGDKPTPKSDDLRISSEQVLASKKILKKSLLEFLKFGVKTWTFCRPSTMYLIEISHLKFYDRTVKFVEIDGKRNYKKDTIDFIEKLLIAVPLRAIWQN